MYCKSYTCIYSTCPLDGALVHVNQCKHSPPLSTTGCCSRAARSTDTLAPHWTYPLERPPSPADTDCFPDSSLCYFTCTHFLWKKTTAIYLVYNTICHFAFISRLWWFLLLFGGKHGCHTDDRQGYLSGNKPNRAQGHGPHLDLLEGLGLGRVA